MDLTTSKPLAIRLALGALFALAGFSKLVAPDATTEVFAAHGIPSPAVRGAVVGALEIAAGVMLVFGIWHRRVSLALMAFVGVMAVVLHSPLALGRVGGRMLILDLALDILVLVGLWRIATTTPPEKVAEPKTT